EGAKLPGSLASTPMLDAWIRIGADGTITVCTGKGELGQGVKTALIQIASEELGVQPAAIKLVTADTRTTPDEGYTAGSNSMKDSGTAIQNAAAQVREILIGRAADKLTVSADKLVARDGFVVTDDGRRAAFGELVGDNLTHVRAQPQSKLKDPRGGDQRVVGDAQSTSRPVRYLRNAAALARRCDRRSRPQRSSSCAGATVGGELPAAVPDARRDRSGMCHCADEGWDAHGVDAQPRRLSAAQIDRRAPAPARGSHSMRARRRRRLLRAQRRGRCRRRCRADRTRAARSAGARATGGGA